ncbi:amidase family protein [Mesobacillus foraminis]|uniref:amidase family protein n=1 Tax=Mesobacillus foraminis TaxID=279826 RepID=UPI00203558BC|nr:amidase family protein [Mesobacillus foraminis]
MKLKVKMAGSALAAATLAFTLALGHASGASAKSASQKTFNVEEATIEDMQKALQSGEITSVELTQMYLDRIAKYDKGGPRINSILEVNPDALEIAEEMDENRKGKGNSGDLYGIPVIVKDNIDTADGMHTSAGSIALANNYAAEDSFVAKQLREAGAIILGKANMTEFANFMTSGMPAGYSSRGGQVLNPYGRGIYSPGGSSAGTGAGIASNLAAAGIGTETSGSILSPASANSLVGIKPTVGLVSRTGIIPIAHSQDTAGPMTRTVEDAAIVLNAIASVDEKDEATKTSIGNVPEDYTKFLKKNGLKGARIGVDRSFLSGMSEEEKAIIDVAIQDMKDKGAVIVDNITVPRQSFNSIVLQHEFKHDLNAYLSNLSEDVPVHSLEELIEFNKQHTETALKYGQTLLISSQAMSDDPLDPRYLEHRATDYRISATEGIDVAMAEYELDALLFANNRGAAMPAKAGYPSVTVPAGYTKANKPVGVTFTAKAYSEPKLIELAYSYEQATKHRMAPALD